MEKQKRRWIPPLPRLSRMNRLESQYADHLELRKKAGEILEYRFEPMRLVLRHAVPGRAKGMTYTPDFLVVFPDRMELHEIKGYWREDSRVKIKASAEMFEWFKFVGVTMDKTSGWKYEDF